MTPHRRRRRRSVSEIENGSSVSWERERERRKYRPVRKKDTPHGIVDGHDVYPKGNGQDVPSSNLNRIETATVVGHPTMWAAFKLSTFRWLLLGGHLSANLRFQVQYHATLGLLDLWWTLQPASWSMRKSNQNKNMVGEKKSKNEIQNFHIGSRFRQKKKSSSKMSEAIRSDSIHLIVWIWIAESA